MPSPARIWDYYIGGKDNFAVDRAVAERVIAVLPSAPLVARLTRQFLARVVAYLAAEHGVRQFLDIGSGLPTADNTHQVAQRTAADSRVVYVDNDPVVIAHANALLVSTPEGSCDYIQADVRDTNTILTGAAKTLDLTQPVAVLMLQLLHFVPDEDDPYGIVRRIMDALPSGSFLVLVQGSNDVDVRASDELTKMSKASVVTLQLRSRAEVARFFDGLELIGPGLVAGMEWLDVTASADGDRPPPAITFGHHGVGRKP